MTTAISSDIQRKLDALNVKRRAQAEDSVATLTTYLMTDVTVDADRLENGLIVKALNAAGEPVGNVFVSFVVIDESATGSTFVLDGKPIGSSFGMTQQGDGLTRAHDNLLTGKSPGTFFVRATVPENADPATVFADFRITISTQVPTSMRIVSRGSPSLPIGELAPPEAVIEVLDQNGKPIDFGDIQTQIYDPNETGSHYIGPGGGLEYLQQGVTPGGSALLAMLLAGPDHAGKEFFLRVNRRGREPHIDVPYVGVDIVNPPARAR